jgi:hypothetical protein
MNDVTIQKFETPPVILDAQLLRMIALGRGALTVAEAYEITTMEDATEASRQMTEFYTTADKLDEFRKAMGEGARKTVEAINNFFRPGVDGNRLAGDIIKKSIASYNAKVREEEERKRRIAEAEARRLREVAEKEAAAARAKAEEEARRAREEADRQRLAAAKEQNAAKAAELAAAAAENDIRARQAVDNSIAKSQQLVMEAEAMKPIVAPTQAVSGVGMRDHWVAVPDIKQDAPPSEWFLRLVRFIGQNPAFLNILEINQSAADKLAGSLKEGGHVDGLRFENQPEAVRTRAKK